MKMGDSVRIYDPDRYEQLGEGIVIASGDHSIAVTLSDGRQICATRTSEFASWFDIETGQPLEIMRVA